MDKLDYTLASDKPFEEVVAAIEKNTAENKFRVLAVHDVQQTLAEKGLKRDPLRIIEVCNATFAHEALKSDINVALFMPCRFAVYTEDDKTIVKLARPEMISQMLPQSGLAELASGVEATLKNIMHASV